MFYSGCTEWPDVLGHAYEQVKTWIFQIVKRELVTLLHDHVVLCRCLNDVTSCHMILTAWLDPKWSLYIGYSEWHQWNSFFWTFFLITKQRLLHIVLIPFCTMLIYDVKKSCQTKKHIYVYYILRYFNHKWNGCIGLWTVKPNDLLTFQNL